MKFKLLVLILMQLSQVAAIASCNSSSANECYSQGVALKDIEAFEKACSLGHGLSCNHAGWNKRKSAKAKESTDSETLFFKKGCELNHAGSCYNYACILASSGLKDQALGTLKKAIINGYRDWSWIREDPDLDSIRSETEFKKIIVRYSSDLNL